MAMSTLLVRRCPALWGLCGSGRFELLFVKSGGTKASSKAPCLSLLLGAALGVAWCRRELQHAVGCQETGSQHLEFAKAGPLYSKLGTLPPAAEWALHGGALASQLSGNAAKSNCSPLELDHADAVRIYHLYLPLYFWMRSLVTDICKARAGSARDISRRAVVVGVSAPQGCGKTTVTNFLVDRFAADGLSCAVLSFDDLYLTGSEQDSVAAANPDNFILQVRGNAGTHDIKLGIETLKRLRSLETSEMHLPCYNKAARGGRGDRAPRISWKTAKTPCDVVLLEGWMAGFKPRWDTDALEAVHPALLKVNENLVEYQHWDDLIDGWCVIALDDFNSVFKWRLQAEHAMAATGRPGMSDAAVEDFVKRYMPAYKAYCPQLYAAANGQGVDGKPTLLVNVDGSRSPIA